MQKIELPATCGFLVGAARPLMALLLLHLLGGCSGGSGSDTIANADFGTSAGAVNYAGPPPASADVQSFKVALWDELQPENRCGSCHGTGGQSPQFVRSDDINLAYNSASGLVDFDIPANSRLVQKVGARLPAEEPTSGC